MRDLLQELSEISDIEFEKCGEIIVAPKRNVFAISCTICQDIFVDMLEFMRHMQKEHDDVLDFGRQSNMVEVYTLNELLRNVKKKRVWDSAESDSENELENVEQIESEEEYSEAEAEALEFLEKQAKKNYGNNANQMDDTEVFKDKEKQIEDKFENYKKDKVSDCTKKMDILKALEEFDVSSNMLEISQESIVDTENLLPENHTMDESNLTDLLGALDDELNILNLDAITNLFNDSVYKEVEEGAKQGTLEKPQIKESPISSPSILNFKGLIDLDYTNLQPNHSDVFDFLQYEESEMQNNEDIFKELVAETSDTSIDDLISQNNDLTEIVANLNHVDGEELDDIILDNLQADVNSGNNNMQLEHSVAFNETEEIDSDISDADSCFAQLEDMVMADDMELQDLELNIRKVLSKQKKRFELKTAKPIKSVNGNKRLNHNKTRNHLKQCEIQILQTENANTAYIKKASPSLTSKKTKTKIKTIKIQSTMKQKSPSSSKNLATEEKNDFKYMAQTVVTNNLMPNVVNEQHVTQNSTAIESSQLAKNVQQIEGVNTLNKKANKMYKMQKSPSTKTSIQYKTIKKCDKNTFNNKIEVTPKMQQNGTLNVKSNDVKHSVQKNTLDTVQKTVIKSPIATTEIKIKKINVEKCASNTINNEVQHKTRRKFTLNSPSKIDDNSEKQKTQKSPTNIRSKKIFAKKGVQNTLNNKVEVQQKKGQKSTLYSPTKIDDNFTQKCTLNNAINMDNNLLPQNENPTLDRKTLKRKLESESKTQQKVSRHHSPTKIADIMKQKSTLNIKVENSQNEQQSRENFIDFQTENSTLIIKQNKKQTAPNSKTIEDIYVSQIECKNLNNSLQIISSRQSPRQLSPKQSPTNVAKVVQPKSTLNTLSNKVEKQHHNSQRKSPRHSPLNDEKLVTQKAQRKTPYKQSATNLENYHTNGNVAKSRSCLFDIAENEETNLENISPTKPNKTKTLLVKLQRMSPEIIAQARQDLKFPQTPKNKKNTLKNALDANRLQNVDYLNVLLNNSAEEEQKEHEMKGNNSVENVATRSKISIAQTTAQSNPKGPKERSAEFLKNFTSPANLNASKVSPQQQNEAIDISSETPIKSNYCKQNFTETSVENNLITVPATSASRGIRERKASIDVVQSPVQSNLDAKSFAINRSARKKEVLQRMHNIKKQIFKNLDKENAIVSSKSNAKLSDTLVVNRTKNVHITNVEYLPKLDIKCEKLSPVVNLLNENLKCNEFKKPKVEHTMSRIKMEQSYTSSKISTTLNNTNLGLSDSVAEFLQHDLKANHLNVSEIANILTEVPVEETMNRIETNAIVNDTETNILDDLLQQVDNEQIANQSTDEISQQETKIAPIEHNQVADCKMPVNNEYQQDIELLDKVGLKIIKSTPEDEDALSLEQYEATHAKARKFSNIYEQCNYLWHNSLKTSESKGTEQIELSFAQLAERTNAEFSENLSPNNLKRIINLLTIWYTHYCNSKMLDKQNIPEAVERYLKLFSFIPKVMRRLLYCEYCAEQFRSELRYFTHRSEHTGLMPYNCRYCSKGFKSPKAYKMHELTHAIRKCSDCRQKLYSDAEMQSHKCDTALLTCEQCNQKFKMLRNLKQHQTLEHSIKQIPFNYFCKYCSHICTDVEDMKQHVKVCDKATNKLTHVATPFAKPKPKSVLREYNL